MIAVTRAPDHRRARVRRIAARFLVAVFAAPWPDSCTATEFQRQITDIVRRAAQGRP